MSGKKDEKVMTAMEEVKALIYAVSNYNADEVRAAARVRANHRALARTIVVLFTKYILQSPLHR